MSEKTQAIAEEIISGHFFRSLMTGKDWTENNLKMLRYQYEIWRDAGGIEHPFVQKKSFDPPEFTAMTRHLIFDRDIDRYPDHSGYHKKFGINITGVDETPMSQPYLRKQIVNTRWLRISKHNRIFNSWFRFDIHFGDYAIKWHPIKKKDWVPRSEMKARRKKSGENPAIND